jgi:hypothetical protein
MSLQEQHLKKEYEFPNMMGKEGINIWYLEEKKLGLI